MTGITLHEFWAPPVVVPKMLTSSRRSPELGPSFTHRSFLTLRCPISVLGSAGLYFITPAIRSVPVRAPLLPLTYGSLLNSPQHSYQRSLFLVSSLRYAPTPNYPIAGEPCSFASSSFLSLRSLQSSLRSFHGSRNHRISNDDRSSETIS